MFLRLTIVMLLLGALLCSGAARAEENADKPVDTKEPKKITNDINAAGPTYVNIAPFVIPVLGPNGPEEMVSLLITLEVSSQEKADFVRARLPRINDAFMRTLYGALDRGTVKRNGLINVTLMKDKLMSAAGTTLGFGFVDDVLVQALAERRLANTTDTKSNANDKPN